MTDLLIKLYNLPDPSDYLVKQQQQGILIRKPIGPEHRLIAEWVEVNFSINWASEAAVALTNRPVSIFIAIKDNNLIGFSCYDATALGFFGPIGVTDSARGHGTGTALLMATLSDMQAKGYGYAIVGWAGPIEFYRQNLGAIEIPDSGNEISLYRTMLTYQTPQPVTQKGAGAENK